MLIANINNINMLCLFNSFCDTTVLSDYVTTEQHPVIAADGNSRHQSLLNPVPFFLDTLRVAGLFVCINVINPDEVGTIVLVAGTTWRLPRTECPECNATGCNKFSCLPLPGCLLVAI